MKLHTLLRSLLLLGLAALTPPLLASDNLTHQLDPVGGTFKTIPGSGGLNVTSPSAISPATKAPCRTTARPSSGPSRGMCR